MLGLNNLSADGHAARATVRGLLSALRRRYGVEYLAAMERHQSGLLHAHVLLHSAPLGAPEVRPFADRAAIQYVDIRPYRDHRGEYLLKNARLDHTRAQHLADNAGMLTLRSSSAFFRDLTTGEVFSGVTEARAAQRRYWRS